MKNIPKKIYLQIGDDCPGDADFSDLVGVTFHHERVNASDIEYTRSGSFPKDFDDFMHRMLYKEDWVFHKGKWRKDGWKTRTTEELYNKHH